VELTLATDALSVLHWPVMARPSDAVAVIGSVAPNSTLVFGDATVTVKLDGALTTRRMLMPIPEAARRTHV